MKLNWLKHVMLVLGVTMILVACGNNEDSDSSSANENDDPETSEATEA